MVKRYHASGLRIKVENISRDYRVAIQGHRAWVVRASSHLEAAIQVASAALGPRVPVEVGPEWLPWANPLPPTVAARSIPQTPTQDPIRMWIKYRGHPFDSYLIKTRDYITLQLPTFAPYTTAPMRPEALDIVADTAARIIRSMRLGYTGQAPFSA